MIAVSSDVERPFVRSPEQMRGYIERLRTDGYEMERLEEMLAVNEEKAALAERLKEYDPTLNGDVNHLVEDLALYRQELETKKEWNVWEYVKSIPGRVWETVKAHPYISTAAVVGLAAAGAYYYYPAVGAAIVGRLRDWIAPYVLGSGASSAMEAAGEAASVAQEAIPQAAATAEEAIGGALESASPMMDVPEALPLPTEVPPLNEAAEILQGLENGG